MTLKVWGFATTAQGSSGGEMLVTPRPAHFYAELNAGDTAVPNGVNDPQGRLSACHYLELKDDGTGHSLDVSDQAGVFPTDANGLARHRQEIEASGVQVLYMAGTGRSIRCN